MVFLLALLAQQAPLHEESFESHESLDRVYDGWERVHSPAHPAYNEIGVVRDPAGAFHGRHVLRLATRGGAVGVQMTPRAAWGIDPRRPYRLSVSVRTSGAIRNRAVAVVQWLNRMFEPLREDVSAPAGPAPEWTPVALELLVPPAGALWARVRLEYGGGDVRGECRFDALSFGPTTRLELRPAGRALPVFEPGEPAPFEVTAYGLEPAGLTAKLRTSVHASGPVDLVAGQPVRIALPPHGPGAYDLTLEVSGPSGVAARREAVLIVPNPWIHRPSTARWIGGSINLFVRDLPDAAGLARLGGFDRLRLTFADQTPPGHRAPDLERLTALADVLGAGDRAELTGVLARPSPALWPDVEPGDVDLLRLGRTAWEKPLRALAKRQASVVGRWEIGDKAGAVGFPTEVLLRPGVLRDPAPVATRPLFAPTGTSAASFVRALLERAAADDRPDAIDVPLDLPLVDESGRPTAALAALRAVNDLLSGATVRREALPLLDVRQLVFEKDGAAVVAFWNEVETEREAHLGEDAIVYPPLGAARPHRPGERLAIGPLPLFVTRVDPRTLESQAGLHFYDPRHPGRPESRLPLRFGPTTRRLAFRNLSREDVLTDLTVSLVGSLPPQWQIRPAELRAARLGPGEEVGQDLSFVLPPAAEEQDVDLKLELSYRRGGREERVRVTRRIEARSAVGVDVTSTPDGPTGRRVSIRFTNRESRPLSVIAQVRLPGLPEQQEPIGPLEPGAARTVEYRLRDIPVADPTRLVAEVLCEERGGDRVYARVLVPIR